MTTELIQGDCREVMKSLADNSVDSIVTDPPYELGFMGKAWDKSGIAYDVNVWRECLRVLKPGGHLLAFGGSRTYHRLACAVEDAGFEIRDQIMWVYGSGFPKSLDVSKAIDKKPKARVEEFAAMLKQTRESLGLSLSEADKVITNGSTMYSFLEGRRVNGELTVYPPNKGHYNAIVQHFGITGWDDIVENNLEVVGSENGNFGYQKTQERWTKDREKKQFTTDKAHQWQGWGTALKPAHEPIVLARKPLIGTVVANVLEWGTGAINVDGCRVGEPLTYSSGKPAMTKERGWNDNNMTSLPERTVSGRFPANFIHDGSEEVVRGFPVTQPSKGKYVRKTGSVQFLGAMSDGVTNPPDGLCDSGSAARFFYCAKAGKRERGEGNNHPTVKPLALMRYLCRLVTPPGGTVLDPFAGSGSTLIAAEQEGFSAIGIEKEESHCEIAQRRIHTYQRATLPGIAL